jgi:hypothetical protein
MAKRAQRKRREPPPTAAYERDDGSVLTLRLVLSPATIAKLGERLGSAAASSEDDWHRRTEMMFERLTVAWEIEGLPLTDQRMLLGRYRMADDETRRWVRHTIAEHVRDHIPELAS